jgi:tetratricopeptide (TPR) repeat protein
MHRWLILIICGLAGLPLLAEQTDSPAPAPTAPASAPTAAKTPDLPPPLPAVIPAGNGHDDGTIQDSLGAVTLRPEPMTKEATPAFLERVKFLRDNGDNVLATDYLKEVVLNGNISLRFRAQAILELADCFAARHMDAESLCWLKIWIELYPNRPEYGAAAFRLGALYSQMQLPDLARDAYYLALAHTVNDAQVQDAQDLAWYTRLTVGTLWALATNEYESGQWVRAAKLFDRFRKEAPSASNLALDKASFLQADCYYQLREVGPATALYEQTLKDHPFHPLAPEARLRLYHLYVLKKAPEKARDELEALAWTVRTVFPKDEVFWQKQTATLLLTLNRKDTVVLPPICQGSARLPAEGKTWQDAISHYDALVSYQSAVTKAKMNSQNNLSPKDSSRQELPEEADLVAMDRSLNQLLPKPDPDSTP